MRRYLTIVIMYESGQNVPETIHPGCECIGGEIVYAMRGDVLQEFRDLLSGTPTSRGSSHSSVIDKITVHP